MRAYMFYGCFLLFFSIRHKNTRQLFSGMAERIFITKRLRGKCSFQRRTEMGARPPINFWGLKTTYCALGGDAWRVSQN